MIGVIIMQWQLFFFTLNDNCFYLACFPIEMAALRVLRSDWKGREEEGVVDGVIGWNELGFLVLKQLRLSDWWWILSRQCSKRWALDPEDKSYLVDHVFMMETEGETDRQTDGERVHLPCTIGRWTQSSPPPSDGGLHSPLLTAIDCFWSVDCGN